MCGIGLKLWIIIFSNFGTSAVTARNCIKISPEGDVFVKLGDDVQMNCSLTSSDSDSKCFDNFDIKNMSLHRGSKTLSRTSFAYLEEDKSVVVTLGKATFDDTGYYRCYYGGQWGSRLTTLKVGVVPGAPEDVVCVSPNFKTLRCHFQLSERITNLPNRTDVKFKMNQKDWITLPRSNCEMTRTTGTCWLDSMTDKPSKYTFMSLAKQYVIQVVTINRLGKNSSNLEINNVGDIVKPDPVGRINVTKRHAGVQLGWACPKALIHNQATLFPMDFKIKLTSEWHNISIYINNSERAFPSTTINDLKPFTNYTITVQAKPSAAIRDIYWSYVNKMVSFFTDSTVPMNTVNTTKGCYMWLNDSQIVLFWKNPARSNWHGNITGYEITLEKFIPLEHQLKQMQQYPSGAKGYTIHGPNQQSYQHLIGLQTSAALEIKLRQNESCKAKVFIKNSEGVSTSYSEIAITSWNIAKMLRPRWVLVEMGEYSVDISWDMSANYCKSVNSVTYFWCKVYNTGAFNRSIVPCVDSINWKTIDITDGCEQNKHQIIFDEDDIKFAVSVHTNDQLTGGMVWEHFRFRKYEVPERPLYSMSNEGSKLKVRVLYADYYTSKGGSPDNYSIEYTECKREDFCTSVAATSKNFSADFLNPVYVIDDLKPDTEYSVRVSSINENGRSMYGETLKVKTEKEPKFENVAAVAGAVSIVIVCSFVGCLAFYIRNRYNLLQNKFAITTPKHQDNKYGTEGPSEYTSFQGDKNNRSDDENNMYKDKTIFCDNLEHLLNKNEENEDSENADKVIINGEDYFPHTKLCHDLNIDVANDIHKTFVVDYHTKRVDKDYVIISDFGEQENLDDDGDQLTNINETDLVIPNSCVAATCNVDDNEGTPDDDNCVPNAFECGQRLHVTTRASINTTKLFQSSSYVAANCNVNEGTPVIDDYVSNACEVSLSSRVTTPTSANETEVLQSGSNISTNYSDHERTHVIDRYMPHDLVPSLANQSSHVTTPTSKDTTKLFEPGSNVNNQSHNYTALTSINATKLFQPDSKMSANYSDNVRTRVVDNYVSHDMAPSPFDQSSHEIAVTSVNTTELSPPKSNVVANCSENVRTSDVDNYVSHAFIPSLADQSSNVTTLTSINATKSLQPESYVSADCIDNEKVSGVRNYVLRSIVPSVFDQSTHVLESISIDKTELSQPDNYVETNFIHNKGKSMKQLEGNVHNFVLNETEHSLADQIYVKALPSISVTDSSRPGINDVTAVDRRREGKPMKVSQTDGYLSHDSLLSQTDEISHVKVLATVSKTELLSPENYVKTCYNSREGGTLVEESEVLHSLTNQISPVNAPSYSDYVTGTFVY